jgi:hypothetical protein
VPGLSPEHYERAISDLMDGPMLEANRALFRRLAAG